MIDHLINEELYYFVCSHNARYYPIFFSWISPLLIKELKDDLRFVHIEVKVSEHRFSCTVPKPLFMFNIDKLATPYVSDANQLSWHTLGDDMSSPVHTIAYPEFFHTAVGMLFEYKLSDQLYQRVDADWLPVNL
jgi:alpha/beta superfamily hydrolase